MILRFLVHVKMLLNFWYPKVIQMNLRSINIDRFIIVGFNVWLKRFVFTFISIRFLISFCRKIVLKWLFQKLPLRESNMIIKSINLISKIFGAIHLTHSNITHIYYSPRSLVKQTNIFPIFCIINESNTSIEWNDLKTKNQIHILNLQIFWFAILFTIIVDFFFSFIIF